jgi:hypothetical protein
VVARVVPARQRIIVLMEFLGRQTMVEVDQATVTRTANIRTGLFAEHR